MRGDPRQVAEAVVKRREGSRNRETLDAFVDVLKELTEFLEISKTDLYSARDAVLAEGEGDAVRRLVSVIGLNPYVHFVKYDSDKENLVHVLNDPCSCAVWRQFCGFASKDPANMTILFFTLKGGIKMVMTNTPVKIPPGEIYHGIKSASKDIPDVYIFGVDKAEKFMYQHFMKG